jgi:HD-GYP domain-containing protein (c-di-GMP phosphodiesterase class II)
MVLTRTVYDHRGYELLESGLELTRQSLITLTKNRVGELFIVDRRLDDASVHPAIAPEVEAEAARSLVGLISDAEITGVLNETLIREAETCVYKMVRELFPKMLGEGNLSGCLSLEDYDYALPAKTAGLALLIGRKAGYGLTDLADLGMAALLMNLGYCLVRSSILRSPNSLLEKVSQEILRHPDNGARLLEQVGSFNPEVIRAVEEHHERWDGSGFPARLKGSEISPFARIIAIADTYFELVSNRPGKPACMPHEAVEFILAGCGDLFDPELALVFVRLVPVYPAGTAVKLNTGELGIVSNGNPGHIARPVIRVCSDRKVGVVAKPYDIDLSESRNQSRLIAEVDPSMPLDER